MAIYNIRKQVNGNGFDIKYMAALELMMIWMWTQYTILQYCTTAYAKFTEGSFNVQNGFVGIKALLHIKLNQ